MEDNRLNNQVREGESSRAARKPRVLVVIVNYKTAALTLKCLESLSREVSSNPWIHVVIVDNDSGDGEIIEQGIKASNWGDWVTLKVAARNGGFSYGNNQGIAPALASDDPPDYFLLLNSDTEIRRCAVSLLVEFMDGNPNVGIAGSSFENPDGSEWPIAFRFPSIASQFEQGIRLGIVSSLLRRKTVAITMSGSKPEPVDWVAGASMMIRRQVFETTGLMDEGYFLYFEEMDFCLQAKRHGWPCWYVPQSRVMHIAGQSTGVSAADRLSRRVPIYWFRSRTRYFVKNYGTTYAAFADIAFIFGLTLWNFRRILTSRKPVDPPYFFADFLKTSRLFSKNMD